MPSVGTEETLVPTVLSRHSLITVSNEWHALFVQSSALQYYDAVSTPGQVRSQDTGRAQSL